MQITRVNLHAFKSYQDCRLDLCPEVNCITGANGSGKTNLLDAIYCLAFTRSAFSSTDQQNIRDGENACSVMGTLQHGERTWQVQYLLPPEGKKVMKVDGEPLPRLSDHIGSLPLVLISPDDQYLIHEGSEARRKFADGLLSQLDPAYLQALLAYSHLVQQRNALLKRFGLGQQPRDLRLLETYDERLLPLAHRIHAYRRTWLDQLQPQLLETYAHISREAEPVELTYQSQLDNPRFDDAYRRAVDNDLYLQRTTMGVHRDDLVFTLRGKPLKKYGSQGQQKSYVLALRLSQYQVMQKQLGFAPLLLLDDVFDKLDDARIQSLLAWLGRPGVGQVFLTDARPERSRALLATLGRQVAHIVVANHQAQRVDALTEQQAAQGAK